ncbi:MAG: AsmA family protein, partial [Rhizobiales bacterium]|nr:AsmA family protein [Hyphomicrobiales bacterium]
MSVWKSPVFYFGILLVAVVTALLAAPYVVNWNGYKESLEAYGNRLTGRTVRIGGDVQIALFPWPKLTAHQVAIGNPAGVEGDPLVHSEVLTLSLQLGGLLNGNLNVDSVELVDPRVTLIRTADGEVNWLMSPDEDLRRSSLLSNVRLDQITITNGTIRIDDRKQGFTTDLVAMDASMSADAIEGPWRLKGTGNWRETPMAVTFSSGTYKDNEPFRFGIRLTPGDPALPVLAVDGGWQDATFEGDLSVTPQDAEGQKGSVEGGLRPLALKARLKANAERADLAEIKIAPADSQDSGTLIEGTAGLDLGGVLKGEIDLKAPRVNLDTLLGAEALAAWRSGGVLALTHSFAGHMPRNIDGRFSLNVSVLTAGGETMNDVQLAATVTSEGIRIENARAGLPGRSAMRLTEGKVINRDGAAELSGVLAFESSDLRAFAGWAMPTRKAGFESWWKGDRGRLKLQGNVAWSPSQVSLTGMQYELEGLPGRGEVVLRQGQVPSLAVRINTESLDLDSLLSSSGATAKGHAFEILAMLGPLLSGTHTIDQHLVLDAGTVTLNGVRAQDVALDLGTSQSGFEIKAFDIGSVGGARLKADGLVLSSADGPSGDVTATLVADDPRGFLRLVGLARNNAQWVNALGQSNVT